MLPVISLCILALAVSLDGFGVGMTYGLRKIRIPLVSIVIISCCSGIIIYGAMLIGVLLAQWISPVAAKVLGSCILVCIGIWAFVQLALQKSEGDPHRSPESVKTMKTQVDLNTKKTIVEIEFKRLGLIVQILRKPSSADVDQSGTISAMEATFLGLALSLDAFGAGIGAALIGFSPLLTAVVIAVASGTFITLGIRIGNLFSEVLWFRKLSVLPGCILIVMGIMKLW